MSELIVISYLSSGRGRRSHQRWLKAGESFYEGPNDVHIVGRNASDSKPAKFVVVLVKKQGVPALLPAK